MAFACQATSQGETMAWHLPVKLLGWHRPANLLGWHRPCKLLDRLALLAKLSAAAGYGQVDIILLTIGDPFY